MESQLHDIERRAFRLRPKEREVLAQRLVESLDDEPIAEVDRAWVAEAERRFRAYKRGELKGVSLAVAFRKARKAL